MKTQAAHFFEKSKQWKEEMNLLRRIILENSLLREEFKWMHPCYTFEQKNVVLIHGFRAYCALLFHKGALLKDPEGLLIRQTENVQSARQIRFTGAGQIRKLVPVIASYIREAVAIEQSGQKVEMKKVADYPVPEEFQQALDRDETLSRAFYSLTPGRQKGYLFYFSQAKRPETRQARIGKYYRKILEGKGMDDEAGTGEVPATGRPS